MFNRPPRIQKSTKNYHVQLLAHPPLPQKPKINWLAVGLPILAFSLVIVLMMVFSSGSSALSYLMFIPFILIAAIVSVANYHQQKSDYAKERLAIFEGLDNDIKNKNNEVDNLKSSQLDILMYKNPSVASCLDLVITQDIRLGERRPDDNDFLSFRIGIGKLNSQINVVGIPIENRDYSENIYKGLYTKADDLVKNSAILEKAPINCDLKDVGSVGIVGELDDLRDFGWSIAIHLLTHHWPAEVNLAAFCSYVEAQNWLWLNETPHKSTIFANAVIELRENEKVQESLLALENELRRRKTVLVNSQAFSLENSKLDKLPALIVLFDRISGVYNHAAFSILLKEGRQLGVYGLFFVDQTQDIPSECGAIISISASKIKYEVIGPDKDPIPDIELERAEKNNVISFSNALASINWLIPRQVTAPPEKLNLMELFPYAELGDLPIEKWWSGNYPFGYLKAPIGKFSQTADLIFDLNDNDDGHGPHGLIGGMTGSGKSELLKTMIISLILTHHPYDLNFALIDYKGGGAFEEFHELPHVVGVITDIQNHADYATRVVQSLSWEIKRREKILVEAQNEFGLSNLHIDQYREKLIVKIPIPHLVIIFDEFAEFQEKHPEESKKLINIARVGRSLGIHMILCTQNPMGKSVDQQVRDNSNFTICLKVKTAETSKALIGIPDAIQLKRGEAYFHVNGPQKFKVAYTGDPYLPHITKECDRVSLSASSVNEASELKEIIKEISRQAVEQKIPNPPAIWTDPLPDILPLDMLFNKADTQQTWDDTGWATKKNADCLQIPLGLMDDPAHQKQLAYFFQDNLLIFGPSGSGKSVALLSLILSIGMHYSPQQANIYCIDLSGQSPLTILENAKMPHLPKNRPVIKVNEPERINRLFNMLRQEISTRSTTKTKGATTNIAEHQTESVVSQYPKIFILIDGINQQFNTSNPGFKDQLDFIVRHGASLGIYVVVTGNLMRDIPDIIQANISQKILLQSIDKSTILSVVGSIPETYQKKIDAGKDMSPGRGLINANPALEFQCCYPANASTQHQGLAYITNIAEKMFDAWGSGFRPLDVDDLPDFIPASEIKDLEQIDTFWVGKSQESLDFVSLSLANDGPIFMIISMASELGKTSALYFWLTELLNQYDDSQLKLVLIDYHSRNLRYFSSVKQIVSIREHDHLSTHVKRKEDLNSTLDWLKSEVNQRRDELEKIYSENPDTFDEQAVITKFGFILIVIDDYEAFANSKASEIQKLTLLIIDGEEVGVRLIFSEDYSLLVNDDLTKRAKKYGCGLLLGGSEGLGIFNGAQPPHGQKTSNLSPGRGYLVRRGKAELIQSIAYWNEKQDKPKALHNLLPPF